MISVIVPALNEASVIAETLGSIPPGEREVLMVDGGSTDGTPDLAAPLARVLQAPRGRARQMNAGAAEARGEVLLFLHADTRLPPDGLEQIRAAVAAGALWGGFRQRYNVPGLRPKVAATLSNFRLRVARTVYGDQALFVRKDAFAKAGGFPDIPLMEDAVLSRRLKRLAPPAILRGPVVTSARRQREMGYLRYWLRCQRTKLLLAMSRSPERAHHAYEKR